MAKSFRLYLTGTLALVGAWTTACSSNDNGLSLGAGGGLVSSGGGAGSGGAGGPSQGTGGAAPGTGGSVTSQGGVGGSGTGGTVGGTGGVASGTGGAVGGAGDAANGTGGALTGTGGAAKGSGGAVSGTGGAALGTGGSSTISGSGGSGATDSYDTVASKGEFSFFTISLKFIKSKAPCSGTDGKTCLGGLGGDLRNGKANGIDGADSLCAEAAQLANPGDQHLWRAFLSASSYNGSVLNAIDRIGTGPWYSAPPQYQKKTSYASEGLLVASDKAGLLKSRPTGDTTTIVYNGVNQSQGAGASQSWPFSQCLLNEYGYCVQADGDDHDTLTGSKSDGTYAGTTSSTCNDWTNSATKSGAPAFGHSWPRQLGASDGSAGWINTGEAGEIGCGAIINVTSTNYMSNGGGMGGGSMGGGGSSSYGGGVGSCGGYGAFYCFAYITGTE